VVITFFSKVYFQSLDQIRGVNTIWAVQQSMTTVNNSSLSTSAPTSNSIRCLSVCRCGRSQYFLRRFKWYDGEGKCIALNMDDRSSCGKSLDEHPDIEDGKVAYSSACEAIMTTIHGYVDRDTSVGRCRRRKANSSV
jgi:hypothetical protein